MHVQTCEQSVSVNFSNVEANKFISLTDTFSNWMNLRDAENGKVLWQASEDL